MSNTHHQGNKSSEWIVVECLAANAFQRILPLGTGLVHEWLRENIVRVARELVIVCQLQRFEMWLKKLSPKPAVWFRSVCGTMRFFFSTGSAWPLGPTPFRLLTVFSSGSTLSTLSAPLRLSFPCSTSCMNTSPTIISVHDAIQNVESRVIFSSESAPPLLLAWANMVLPSLFIEADRTSGTLFESVVASSICLPMLACASC